MARQKRRDKRYIILLTKFMAEAIASTCRELLDDHSNVYVYNDYVVTHFDTWVVCYCTKEEWKKIEELYNLKRIREKYGYLTYKIEKED